MSSPRLAALLMVGDDRRSAAKLGMMRGSVAVAIDGEKTKIKKEKDRYFSSRSRRNLVAECRWGRGMVRGEGSRQRQGTRRAWSRRQTGKRAGMGEGLKLF